MQNRQVADIAMYIRDNDLISLMETIAYARQNLSSEDCGLWIKKSVLYAIEYGNQAALTEIFSVYPKYANFTFELMCQAYDIKHDFQKVSFANTCPLHYAIEIQKKSKKKNGIALSSLQKLSEIFD